MKNIRSLSVRLIFLLPYSTYLMPGPTIVSTNRQIFNTVWKMKTRYAS